MNARVGLGTTGVQADTEPVEARREEPIGHRGIETRSIARQADREAAALRVPDHLGGVWMQQRLATADEIDLSRSERVQLVDEALEISRTHQPRQRAAELAQF